MLLEVARRFNVALDEVYMVGDAQRDLEAAAAAGAKPVLVLTGKGSEDARRRQAAARHARSSPISRRSPRISHRDSAP